MKREKKKYLITVRGFLSYCSPNEEIVSVLVETTDPVKWFLSNPVVYSRSKFTPNALINFWEVS